ncbi:MAG: hypothetical protein AAFR47_11730 [Pseudomonadota bacterium]
MLAVLMQAASVIGGLVTLTLAVGFACNPQGAMEKATHRPEKLPMVMAGRYMAFTALAFGAALYGDPVPILYLFAVFSAVSFFDAWIYAREGQPWGPHAAAGAACFVTIALAAALIL